MDVDDCFTHVVGAFGRYQIIICIFAGSFSISVAGLAILPVFIAANVPELHLINPRVKNDSSILLEWDLLDKPWISDLIQAIYFSGFLIGVILIGQISDKIGRKLVLKVGFTILFPFCLLLSFSNSWQMFAALRFAIGFFGGGVGLVLYVYIQESIGRQWWAWSCAFQGCFFPLGLMFFSLLAYFVPSWRSLLQILSILQLPFLVFTLFLPESARWLYSKKRYKEAEEVLTLFAKRNGVKDAICSLKPLDVYRLDKNPGLFALLKNKITLKRIVVISYVWFVTSFVYYALTLAAGELGSNLYLTTFFSAVLELIVHAITPLLINRKWCGRRPSVNISLLIGGFACLMLMAFDPKVKTIGLTVVGISGRMSISFTFVCIYAYSPELFPTHVRNVAVGTASMFARVGGILSSFSKTFLALHPMMGYFTFGFCGISSGLFTLLLPETYGRKPPDSFNDLYNELSGSQETSIKFKKLKDYSEKDELLEDEEEDAL